MSCVSRITAFLFNKSTSSSRLQATLRHYAATYSSPLVSDAPKPELVEQFLDLRQSPRRERLRIERKALLIEFQRHPHDVGSPEVAVANVTHRIRGLIGHFQKHRKNYHHLRSLELMLFHRRRLLKNLREQNFEAYSYLLCKLGLKDIYQVQTRHERYPIGSRLGTPPVSDHNLRRVFTWKYKTIKTNQWTRLKGLFPDVLQVPGEKWKDLYIDNKVLKHAEKRKSKRYKVHISKYMGKAAIAAAALKTTE